jgi:membrane protein DedA with SNARE-associated domain
MHDTIAHLIGDYGYLAVLVGSLLEGETVLVLAGVAAHRGYLSLPLVVAVAFVGGTLGDQVFYWIGRTRGAALLARMPRAAPQVARVEALLARWHAPLIVGIRFMYGLRLVGPVVIGMCRVPPLRFALFNMLGAAIWAPLVAGAGFLFGHALQAVLDRVVGLEVLALGLAVAGVLVVAVRALRRARARQTD